MAFGDNLREGLRNPLETIQRGAERAQRRILGENDGGQSEPPNPPEPPETPDPPRTQQPQNQDTQNQGFVDDLVDANLNLLEDSPQSTPSEARKEVSDDIETGVERVEDSVSGVLETGEETVEGVKRYVDSLDRRVKEGTSGTFSMSVGEDSSRTAAAGDRSIYESAKEGNPASTVFVGGEALSLIGKDAGSAVKDALPLEDVGPKISGEISAMPTVGTPTIPGVQEGGRPTLSTEVGGDDPQTAGEAAEGVAAAVPGGLGLLAGQAAQAPIALGGLARQKAQGRENITGDVAEATGEATESQAEFAKANPGEAAGLLALPYAGKAARSFTPKGKIGSRIRNLGRERVGSMSREAVESGEISYPSFSKNVEARSQYTTRQNPKDFPVEASGDPVAELKALSREFTPDPLKPDDGYMVKQVVDAKRSSKPGSKTFEFQSGRKYDTEGGFVGGDLFLDIKGAASKGGSSASVLPRPMGTGAALSLARNVRESGLLGGLKETAAGAKKRASNVRKRPNVVGLEVSDISRMPEGISSKQAADRFLQQADPTQAYVRSPERITAEAEGIIPAGAEFVKTGTEVKTRARGIDIPVDVYEPAAKVGERLADNAETMSKGELRELAQEKTGKEAISRSELAKKQARGEAAVRRATREGSGRPSTTVPETGTRQPETRTENRDTTDISESRGGSSTERTRRGGVFDIANAAYRGFTNASRTSDGTITSRDSSDSGFEDGGPSDRPDRPDRPGVTPDRPDDTPGNTPDRPDRPGDTPDRPDRPGDTPGDTPDRPDRPGGTPDRPSQEDNRRGRLPDDQEEDDEFTPFDFRDLFAKSWTNPQLAAEDVASLGFGDLRGAEPVRPERRATEVTVRRGTEADSDEALPDEADEEGSILPDFGDPFNEGEQS
jgi:hypothetical protein